MLLSPGKEKAHPKQRRMAKSQITSSLGRSCPGPDHSHEDKSNTEQHWDANASCVHLTSFHVPVVLTYEGWTARILERVCRREPIFPLLCVCRRVAASSLRSIMDLLCIQRMRSCDVKSRSAQADQHFWSVLTKMVASKKSRSHLPETCRNISWTYWIG